MNNIDILVRPYTCIWKAEITVDHGHAVDPEATPTVPHSL